MKESGDGFVRADRNDLKSLDEQLERGLRKVRTMDKKKRHDDDGNANLTAAASATATSTNSYKKERQDWEIEPSKLIIQRIIARGTFGTVHRGICDGHVVAVKLLDWGEEGQRSEVQIASLRAAFSQEVSV